mgnify:CR=1 FL=1
MAASGDPATPPRRGDRSVDAERRYRLAGVGLALLGVAGGVAAALVDPGTEREILVAFAGVGLYGAVLAYVVRPAATRDADPAERVYDAFAATGAALRDDLGLPDRSVYAPVENGIEGLAPVHLVIPADGVDGAPTDRRPVLGNRAGQTEAAESGQTVTESGQTMTESGATPTANRPSAADAIAVYPTGAALFDAFEELAVVDLETEPVELGDQLAEAAVSGLGLAADVDPRVDEPAGRATMAVTEPRFGDATRFDHPAASFLAVGFAMGLDAPVTTSVESGDDESPASVVCEWDPGRTAGAAGADGAD